MSIAWVLARLAFQQPVNGYDKSLRQTVAGGEFIDALGAFPPGMRAYITTFAQERYIDDECSIPKRRPSLDVLYNGLTNWASGAALTQQQHDAIQKRLNVKEGFFIGYFMICSNFCDIDFPGTQLE